MSGSGMEPEIIELLGLLGLELRGFPKHKVPQSGTHKLDFRLLGHSHMGLFVHKWDIFVYQPFDLGIIVFQTVSKSSIKIV